MPRTRSAHLTLLGLALIAGPAGAQDLSTKSALGQGWTFLEKAGNLRMAEEKFTAAYSTPEGKNSAEVYYALAAVWWERRNAMAAYMWLSNAVKTAQSSHLWDGGPDHEWDRRIAGRLRYIERNFTVIKLRAPRSGKPLGPLADPPPADPLQREFVDAIASSVAEGVAADMAVQWLLLPNGTYWVGDDLRRLEGGEMDPAKSQSWDLPKDGGALKKRMGERQTAIAAGNSLATAVLAKEKAVAAEEARRREQEAEHKQEEMARLAREEAERQREEKERAAREVATAAELEAQEAARREAESARAAEDARRTSEERARAAEAERRDREAREARAREQEAEAARRAEAERRDQEAREARAREEEAEAARRAETERRTREVEEARRAREAEEVRAREAARVARQQEDERRAAEAAAERGAEAARRTEEAAAEERRQQAWNEARERAEELARREVEEKDAARREIRAIRQPGPTEDSAEEARFGRVHVGLRGGVAGVTVAGVDGDGTATAVLASYGAELDAFLPLKAPHVALKLGASYTNLPVSGCSWAQTRSHTVSGHIGPRFAAPIKGRTWFAVDVDLHVGGGFGAATQADLDGCAEARSAGDPARYVTTIETEHGTARLGLGELGWRWATFALGPGLDAGILASPGERAPWLGLSFYLRHDQVFAVLPGGDLWFRPEGEGSLTLVKTTVDSLDARTAMARFQFGLRGQIQF